MAQTIKEAFPTLDKMLSNMDDMMELRKYLRQRIDLSREDGGNMMVSTFLTKLRKSQTEHSGERMLWLLMKYEDHAVAGGNEPGKVPVVVGEETFSMLGGTFKI